MKTFLFSIFGIVRSVLNIPFCCCFAYTWLVFLSLQDVLQAQTLFRGTKVYSNNAAWGEVVANFRDSTVSGKFIGSPRFDPPAMSFDLIALQYLQSQNRDLVLN